MKLCVSHLRAAVLVFAATALTTALAVPPTPITADEAFDAVMDPRNEDVALVDLRDPVEYYWSGAPVAVTKIHFLDEKKAPVVPDNGKVRLIEEGKFLEYTIHGRYQRTQVTKIGQLETEQIAINIPFKIGIPGTWVNNPNFYSDMERLYESGINVVILYCRTGGRSSSAGEALTTPFTAIYEIDDPNGADQFGGFSGSTYGGVYNGYVGFPGRQTDRQGTPSVSWSDSGLPIATRVNPIQLPDEDEP